jgi:hypothetical protein
VAEPLYGRRPDGTARDPWHSREDARALGFRSPADFRLQRGRARRPGASTAELLGHGGRHYSATVLDASGRLIRLDGLSYGEFRRVRAQAQLQRELVEGRLSSARYAAITRGRRPIAGVELAADPAVVLAATEMTDRDDWVFES